MEAKYFEALKEFSEKKINQEELTDIAVQLFKAKGKDQAIALSMVKNDIAALGPKE